MSYNKPGWKIKDMKEFTLVTQDNRKNAVVMGRILYVIDSIKTFNGYFAIRPRLTKGQFKVSKHPHEIDQQYWVNEEETLDDYRSSFDKLITLKINDKELYFKLTDKLVTYEK